MANPEHIKILQEGVDVWNQWRESTDIEPDLRRANLSNLEKLSFRRINLSHAKLRDTNLSGLDLARANLTFADLVDAILVATNLANARLSHANLGGANLSLANLAGANLRGASLENTIFSKSEFSRTSLRDVSLGSTVFNDVDLSRVVGLRSAVHLGPSSIGVDTLLRSGGGLPEDFLRDAGIPASVISYLPSLLGAIEPIQFYSCFISYSTKNEAFAQRLHARMRQAGLRVWFDREDMKGGDYLHTQIDRAIQLHDRLLLVLSEESIQSKWVEREIKRTRKIEREEMRRKLFPIRLVDMKTLREWECLDSDTGEDLAEEVRKYHIPDFSNWKNHDAFETAFARLEKDLRASVSK